jgi:hypothetical protein
VLHATESKPGSANGGGGQRRVSAPALDADALASLKNLRSGRGNQTMLRMQARGSRLSPLPPSRVLQRKCACGGTCADCAPEAEGSLRRSAAGTADSAMAPPIVLDVLASPGQPLDAATRADMEVRFGHDFGHVRVHADGKAAQSAAAVSARAWTVGADIAFGGGMYEPSSRHGSGLLAHELAHVVQQRNLPRTSSGLTIGEPGDAFEREAEAAATAVAVDGTPHHPASLAQPRVQRSFLSGLLDVLLFVPRLFGLETFPAEDLQKYLATLKQKKGPEDGIFSDNKARACVSRESEFGPYDTQTKIWLIQEMLGGYTSFLDEGAIITLLRRSAAEVPKIVSAIGRDKLWSNFSGGNRHIIEAMTLTAADAGDALVDRLRKLDPDEIQDYAANAIDPAVKESARRAAALAKITAPVPTAAAVSPTGEADFTINGIKVIVRPDAIDPSLGTHGMTYSQFAGSTPAKFVITPDNANIPVGEPSAVELRVTIWTAFPSEESKQKSSAYGVGTRPQDKPTLRYHERAHGEAWFKFLNDNPPPVFAGKLGMLPADYNAAVDRWEAAFEDYQKRAHLFALKAGDCVGKLPTDADYAGTGFTAAICHEN